ncbi:MAG: site-specific integrase [Gammaproteobacteria bacterium]|nr:site-specific integrase [Gammaproteobacteria bacterium]
MIKLTSDIVKTDKGRYIPLDAKLSNMLRQWYQQLYPIQQGRGWVFPGSKPDSHITSIKKSWKALMQRANIENFTWHDMRHDYASQLVMSGVDLNTVRELLGHSDIKMTLRYAHLAPEHKKDAIIKLGKRRDGLLR